MSKLRPRIEELAVESYATDDAVAPPRGTVRARVDSFAACTETECDGHTPDGACLYHTTECTFRACLTD